MEDQDFRIFCNMLDGLAFLPIADLPEGIAYIRSVITEEPAETEELVDYFETTYVTGTYRPVQRNGEQRLTMRRVPPMFPPSIWSVHSATVDSDPRTNNVGEGWNNKFFTLVGSAHPSIWTCIQWFQREHATVTTVIQQNAIGTQPTKRINQKQVLLQKRLQNQCNDRISGRKTIAQFLHGVAFNIRLFVLPAYVHESRYIYIL